MKIKYLFIVLTALCVCACTSMDVTNTGSSANVLTQTHWKLTWLASQNQLQYDNSHAPDLSFNQDKQRVAGSTGCNRFMGSYKIEGQKISFSKMATTMMACHTGMKTERAYMDALQQVSKWSIANGKLVLLNDDNEPVARFEKK